MPVPTPGGEMPITAESLSRAQDPGPLITLYELDLTKKVAGLILRFHDGIQQGDNLIVFAGKEYTPYPIRAEEFEWNVQGTLPRPKLSVSNIGGIVSALCRDYDDLVGCSLTQIQTFAAFIRGGSNPDSSQHLPIYKFTIERKASETNQQCTFELSMPSDAEGVLLPRRMIIANTCPWRYRGPECTYAGVPKANDQYAGEGDNENLFGTTVDKGEYNPLTHYAKNDAVWVLVTGVRQYAVSQKADNHGKSIYDTEWWDLDVCLKRYPDCELHFPQPEVLPYGGFPGSQKVQ